MGLKSFFLSITLLLTVILQSHAQQLVSATFAGSKTKEQLTALFPLPFIKYGVKYYWSISTARPTAKAAYPLITAMPEEMKVR
ncbi:MAG: hypothetical protein LW630_10650 [Saprospiraceae bacterium]|nr:hypothetical protein [Saprospiraceae bacterium]